MISIPPIHVNILICSLPGLILTFKQAMLFKKWDRTMRVVFQIFSVILFWTFFSHINKQDFYHLFFCVHQPLTIIFNAYLVFHCMDV